MRWRGPAGPSALARRLPGCRTPRDPHRHRAPVARVGLPPRPPFRSYPRGGPASVVRAVLLPIAGRAQGLGTPISWHFRCPHRRPQPDERCPPPAASCQQACPQTRCTKGVPQRRRGADGSPRGRRYQWFWTGRVNGPFAPVPASPAGAWQAEPAEPQRHGASAARGLSGTGPQRHGASAARGLSGTGPRRHWAPTGRPPTAGRRRAPRR
jgi:hypothetical protein